MTDSPSPKAGTMTPVAWMVLGGIVLALGLGYLAGDNSPALGVVASIAGAAMLLFGGVAQAVKLGTQSAGDDRENPR